MVLRDMGEAFLGAVGRKRTLTLERHLVPAADIADDGWLLEGASPRLPNYLVDPGPPGGQAGAAGMPQGPHHLQHHLAHQVPTPSRGPPQGAPPGT